MRQGWSELTNGELLRVAEADGFEVMVSADQNLGYQQNLKDREARNCRPQHKPVEEYPGGF